jgi:hypothetical protein
LAALVWWPLMTRAEFMAELVTFAFLVSLLYRAAGVI